MNYKFKIGLLLTPWIAGAIVLTSCSITDDTLADPSFSTLRYGGGFNEGSKFKECLEPGQKLVGDDTYYRYPTSQREDVWDTDQYHAGSNSADHPDLPLIDKNGVTVNAKVKVQFHLNTDCTPVDADGRHYKGGVIQAFHEKVGKTRKAYFKSDGSYGGEQSGWIWAMDNYLSSSVIDYLYKHAQEYTADDMWRNPKVSEELRVGLAEALPQLVNDGMETDLQFYRDFTVKFYKLVPEAEYTELYKSRQNAKIAAETAEANRATKVAEAKANAAVAEEEAKVKRAEISGYGGFDSYKCIYLADHGMNCAQPTYIVSGTEPK